MFAYYTLATSFATKSLLVTPACRSGQPAAAVLTADVHCTPIGPRCALSTVFGWRGKKANAAAAS